MRFDANTNLGSWDPDNSAITLEEIGCFDLPVGPDGDYGNYSITPWALGISYGSTQKDAAWALINWMASSEMQQDAQSNGSLRRPVPPCGKWKAFPAGRRNSRIWPLRLVIRLTVPTVLT